MKRTILLIAILLAGLRGAHAGMVSLVPSMNPVFVNDLFSVDLVITGNTDEILGFGFDYAIGGSALTLQGVTINPFFGPDFGLGDPMLSAFTFPGSTDATVTLATFQFLAVSQGISTLDITSDLSDPNEGLFTLNGAPTDLTAGASINAVPEPASAVLGLTVLGLLATARRRRKN